jgi:Domain of unknown function (DUF4392)
MSIETIILAQDKRGIAALRPHLSPHYCTETAQFLLGHPGTVFIATGFYILNAQAPETDGPPGALALGKALTALGRKVVYVSDAYTTPLLAHLAGPTAEVIDFPIVNVQASRQHATELLARFNPALLIAIERCGLTHVGTYLNMRGRDISAMTARLDELFMQHPHSIGIGDGGNEIGMGNLAPHIPSIDTLPDMPATTRTTHLVIASVANWGAYGVIAALSALVDQNLLPAPDAETALIRRAVAFGAVDGTNSQNTPTVDGFSLSENEAVLARLHSLLRE